jgi:hypothetical protein
LSRFVRLGGVRGLLGRVAVARVEAALHADGCCAAQVWAEAWDLDESVPLVERDRRSLLIACLEA